jgi:quercetin dioxygenase-like cupin family protein
MEFPEQPASFQRVYLRELPGGPIAVLFKFEHGCPISRIETNRVLEFEVNAMPKPTDGNETGSLGQFDLQREIADAKQKKPWPSGIHSKTLVKRSDFRAVLIAMEAGAKMDEHHADGTISVQPVKGHIRIHAQGQSHELRVGQLFALGASIKHDVESLEDSAFLLTIAWPSDQELRAIPHRGYGS